jgi:hypothetical protein
MKSLEEMREELGHETVREMVYSYAFSSIVPACCDNGCMVEPDGKCSHGHPSILLEYGLV